MAAEEGAAEAEAAAAEEGAAVSAAEAHPEDGEGHQNAEAAVLPRNRGKQSKAC